MNFAPLPDQTPPLLYGPEDVVEGYYDLEVHERNQTFQTLPKHKDAVELWYRALTLYRRAILGRWEFTEAEANTPELTSAGLQLQLLGLGVSSMKAALDMLLAGYYSVAFGVIRHMLETFVQCIYARFEPDEARLWYEQEGGIGAQKDPPGMLAMCQAIQAVPEVKGTRLHELIDDTYGAWRLMSKGAHPSGVGIRQTEGESEGKFIIGASYRPDLCLAGFDIGLFAVSLLLPQAIIWAKPEVGKWEAEWEKLATQVIAWRVAHEMELRAAEGDASTEPQRVPAPSIEDVKRCQRLIQAREDDMNRIRSPISTVQAAKT
jgi:hypothetical protein